MMGLRAGVQGVLVQCCSIAAAAAVLHVTPPCGRSSAAASSCQAGVRDRAAAAGHCVSAHARLLCIMLRVCSLQWGQLATSASHSSSSSSSSSYNTIIGNSSSTAAVLGSPLNACLLPPAACRRAVKVHERRVSKARAKANFSLARRLLRAKPGYKLDHLVRER
mgnify:CR=1 FL=1